MKLILFLVIMIFAVSNGTTETWSYDGHTEYVVNNFMFLKKYYQEAIAYSSVQNKVYSGSWDKSLRVIDADSGNLIQTKSDFGGEVKFYY